MKKQILILSLISLFVACSPADDKKQLLKKSYFDLQGYFEKEEARLKIAHPLTDKTVSVGDSSEHQSLKITDWKKELSIFTDADINKTAWEGLFHVKKDRNVELYTSNDEKVPVKELKVMHKGGKISGIQILIENANTLYTSIDTLSYYPDSLYQVKKTQHIRLLSEKKYEITGRFR